MQLARHERTAGEQPVRAVGEALLRSRRDHGGHRNQQQASDDDQRTGKNLHGAYLNPAGRVSGPEAAAWRAKAEAAGVPLSDLRDRTRQVARIVGEEADDAR